MRLFLLSGLAVTDWLAVGTPLRHPNAPPMGVLDSLFVVGVLVLGFYVSVRLAVWLDVKVRTHELLRELYRELGIGRGPGRTGFGRHT